MRGGLKTAEAMTHFDEDSDFEDEVRRIARLLWPAAALGGAELVDGRERDGIFITDDFVHLIECTTSRMKAKAESDIPKLVKLAETMRKQHSSKAIRGWFITRDEPTADQRAIANKHPNVISAVSFDSFRTRLVDARTYLHLRHQYSFGSARDPETGDREDKSKYVPTDIVGADAQIWDVNQIADALATGQRALLLGDYGSGKSSTCREIFVRLERRFVKKELRQFPVFLNLRDHHGQTDSVEVLERHARRLGFPSPSHLVRAWRAGYVLLILDGFDEIATPGWSGHVKRLRDIRYNSLRVLREFMRDGPSSSGMLLSGREHFFDSPKEMVTSLGSVGAVQLRINEFTDEQIAKYLASRGWKDEVPTWLPARPLLLAYLASRKVPDKTSKSLLGDLLETAADYSPAAGWDYLLKRVSEREADIEAGIDGTAVRSIIERLASHARCELDGVGPIASEAILQVFREVCGYSPDDRALVLLQRLPGLGPHNAEDGSKKFIDKDLADAAAAGDVVGYIGDPFARNIEHLRFEVSLGELGVELGRYKCAMAGWGEGKLVVVLKKTGSGGCGVLCADLVRIGVELGVGYPASTAPTAFVKEAIIPELAFDVDSPSLSGVEFQDCLIGTLELPRGVPEERLPRFIRCSFTVVEGRAGKKELPSNFGEGCSFEGFAETALTTAGILDMSLPLGTRVMLTILKKLYFQRGSGRKESALFRGLDHRAKGLVPEVLGILARENLAMRSATGGQTVWLPVRAKTARVQRLMSAPGTSGDVLLNSTASIGGR